MFSSIREQGASLRIIRSSSEYPIYWLPVLNGVPPNTSIESMCHKISRNTSILIDKMSTLSVDT